ncbi:unnamed protein product [Onchocerca flexuosa]|uniref:Uncharacterized protein n=1 Tax=Onchocerca flexuosa TaxID=387005 RepID=A0A183H6H1_9BILA|nr:unnamed protein product [Onchocerca flexuosa]
MEEKLNVIGDALEAIYNTTVSNERRAAATEVSKDSSLLLRLVLLLISALFADADLLKSHIRYNVGIILAEL